MTIDRDPPRLFELSGVDDGLQRALRTAAHDAPSSACFDALLAAVPIVDVAMASEGAQAGQAAVGKTKLMGKLLWLKVGGAVLITVGSIVWLSAKPREHTVHERAQSVVSTRERVEASGAASSSRMGAANARKSESIVAGEVSATPSDQAPIVSALRSAAQPVALQIGAGDGEGSIVSAAKEDALESKVEQRVMTADRAQQKTASSAHVAPSGRAAKPALNARVIAKSERVTQPARESAQESDDEGASELQLIERAQLSLVRAPEQTLRILETHRARFPDGVFSEEREVLRMDALSALGRVEEARVIAKRFVARYPQSVHRAHAEGLAR